MGTTNTTTGVSPSTLFLSPMFHTWADKPKFPRAGGSPSAPARVSSATSHEQRRLRRHETQQGQGRSSASAGGTAPRSRHAAGAVCPSRAQRGPCPAPHSSAAPPSTPGERSQGPSWSLGMVSPPCPGTSNLLALPPSVCNPSPAAARLRKPLQGPARGHWHLPSPAAVARAAAPAHQQQRLRWRSVMRCHGSATLQPPATGTLRQLQKTDNCSGLSYFAFSPWQRARSHPLLPVG